MTLIPLALSLATVVAVVVFVQRCVTLTVASRRRVGQ